MEKLGCVVTCARHAQNYNNMVVDAIATSWVAQQVHTPFIRRMDLMIQVDNSWSRCGGSKSGNGCNVSDIFAIIEDDNNADVDYGGSRLILLLVLMRLKVQNPGMILEQDMTQQQLEWSNKVQRMSEESTKIPTLLTQNTIA